jgi:lysophospholipase L1-like esterase
VLSFTISQLSDCTTFFEPPNPPIDLIPDRYILFYGLFLVYSTEIQPKFPDFGTLGYPDDMNSSRRQWLRRLAVGGLVLLLAISVAINVRMANRVRDLKLTMDTQRMDPLGLNRYARERQTQVQPGQIVMYGDSRAESWPPPPGIHKQWINRGLGGETTTGSVARYAVDVDPLKPAIVVIEVGINELRLVPLMPQKRIEIVSKCANNLQKLLQNAQKSGNKVVLCTIFSLGDISWKDWPYDTASATSAIEEVNAWIAKQSSPDVRVFDTNALLSESGKVKAEYQMDGLHLNEAGYQRLNEGLLKVLGDWDAGK